MPNTNRIMNNLQEQPATVDVDLTNPASAAVAAAPAAGVAAIPVAVAAAPAAVAAPAPTSAAAAGNTGKRAASTLYGEEDAEADPDDDDTLTFEWDCDKVRRMIRTFLDSGEMNVTQFRKTIGTNSNSYGKFMSYKGAWRGVDNSAMAGAYLFFKKREREGVAISKKRKTTDAAPEADGLAAIHLDGEETDSVQVYDSCDEIRRKLGAHMRKPGVIQAKLLKDLAAQFHAQGQPVKLQAKQLTDFRAKRGAIAGNTSRVYYAAYVFFEKLRLKEGKPKSKHRLEMERLWAAEGGVDTKRAAHNQRYLCSADSVVYTDEYGCVRS